MLLMALILQQALASWAPLNPKTLSCHTPLIVTGELVEVSEDLYQFTNMKPPQSVKTFRKGELKVKSFLKIDQKEFAFEPELKRKKVIDILVISPQHTGAIDHMVIRHSKGNKGIWFLDRRDYWTGHLIPYSHPQNPYPMTNIKLVQEAIKSCP